MKKVLAMLLAATMVLSLAACGSSSSSTSSDSGSSSSSSSSETSASQDSVAASDTSGGKIYVLGPTPDHGWTAQAGAYAQQRCAEITEEGRYEATYIAANDAEEQVDQIATVIANGDAIGVVIFALDYGSETGELQLTEAGIPWIAFDRIIDTTQDYAILNTAGNSWQVGAGTAKYMLENGLEKGDVFITLYGDNGIICDRRKEGFEQYLAGELEYYDAAEDKYYNIDEAWSDDEIAALFADYSAICDWSADLAYEYLEQKLDEIVAKAAALDGKLFCYSMDDEMTFGFLNLLEGNAISDSTKETLEGLDVYVTAVGGMEELYEVMRGNSTSLSPVADQYFDGLMSVYWMPDMMIGAIDKMLDYLDGNWDYPLGAEELTDVWLVTRDNADQYVGFTGH